MPEYNPYINQYTYNPYVSNPAVNYQQRLQMEQAYPQFAQQYQQQVPQTQAQQPALKGCPVTSFEEAQSAMIDYGTPYIFTDISNGKIYTKHLGVDGIGVINTYILQKQQEKPSHVDEISGLHARVNEMEQKIKSYEGMFLNGIQHNANVSNATKPRKSNADASNDGRQQSAIKAGD